MARELFAEYAASIAHLAGASLNAQRFEQELASLPGRYAEPEGRIVLAFCDGRAAGCAALRPIGALAEDCGPVGELKRMDVRPEHRGRGLGRGLAERIIADARAIGYATLKLDTDPRFDAALGLYRSLGFEPTRKFNDDPEPCTLYFAMRLREG